LGNGEEDARIVHQYVEPAKPPDGGIDAYMGLRLMRYIAGMLARRSCIQA
jgi:hypothetical protein